MMADVTTDNDFADANLLQSNAMRKMSVTTSLKCVII